ncbi:MAG: DUF3458 domain-containing protein [Acidobacteria bacterium]|nr:DUF3458 domain-containing protein [Acidobacteriota bacterium]
MKSRFSRGSASLGLALILLSQILFARPSYPVVIQREEIASARRALEERHWRNHDFDQQHIRLDLRFDPARKSVKGSVTHTIKPVIDGFEVVELDAVNLDIAQVRLAGGLPLRFEVSKERLRIHLDRAYRRDESITLSIDYSTTNPKKGITFIGPDAGYPDRPQQLWSQGEAEESRHWIPLYDHPNDKATTEALITVPRPLTAVSNGKLIAVTEDSDGTRTFHWSQSKPHSCYLITVSAAEYVEIHDKAYQGIPIVYYALKEQARDTLRTLAKTPAMMAFFAEKIGFPYPWEKYATVLASGFPGAMENTSATTVMDTAIHDERAALDVTSDDIASHEIAHQWWGNTVTFRNWTDLWLSEGFASYSENLWEEHDLGWDQASYSRGQENQIYIMQARHRLRPVVYAGYDDPEELFDITTYSKGGAVVHMMRFVLGDEGFWKALRHFIRKHAFGSVDTNDLKIAIREATGQDLGWFFEEWLEKSGWPEFEVSYRYDVSKRAIRLRVRQVQETNEQVPVFRIPVEVEIVSATGRRLERVMIDQREHEFTLATSAEPLAVNFDPRNWILKTVKFKKSKAEWLYQLKHDPQALNRVRAVEELRAFLAEDEVIEALQNAMSGDKFWAVRSEAAHALGDQEGERIRAILISGLKDSDAKVRRAAVTGLARYNDETTIGELKRVFAHDPSYFASAAAVSALAQIGGPAAQDVVMTALQRDSYQEVIRAAGLNGLIAIEHERTLEIAMEFAAYGKPGMLRTEAIRALGRFGQGRGEVTLKLIGFLKDQSTFVRLTTVSALGNLGDESALSPLEELSKGETDPMLQGAVHQAIERIQAAMKKAREVEKKAA